MNKSYANKMVFLLNQKYIQNYSKSRNKLKKAKLKYDERKNLYLSLPKLNSNNNSENEKEIEQRNKNKYNFNYQSKSTKNILSKNMKREYFSSSNNLSLNLIDFNDIKLKVRRLKNLNKKIIPDNIFKTIDNKNLYFYHKNKNEDKNNLIQENLILKEQSKNNMEKIRKGLIVLNELAKESSSLDTKTNPLRRKTTLKRIFSFNSKI